MSATNDSIKASASGQPQVDHPKPPMAAPPPHPVVIVIAIIIIVLCILMTVKLYDIDSQLKTLNSNTQSGINGSTK